MDPNFLFIFITMLTPSSAHFRVPVFLISSEETYKESSLKTNPFHDVSSGDFADILSDLLDKSDTVIVFAEENLSPEDISMQDNRGTPYGNLHHRFKEAKATFFPAVHMPYKVITQNLKLSTSNYLNLSDADANPTDIYKRKFFYIFFVDDPDTTRAEKLRHHDAVMEQVFTSVRNTGSRKVAAVYTGIRNPVTDSNEELPDLRHGSETPLTLSVQSKSALFRFTGLSVKTALRQTLDYHTPLGAEEFSRGGDSLTTRVMSPDFVLDFHFLFGKETWLLDRVTMMEDGEEVGSTRMDVRVPWRRSFLCADPLVVVNNRDGSAVVIPHYQLEPFQPKHLSKRQAKDVNENQLDNDSDYLDGMQNISQTSPRYHFTKSTQSQWTSSMMYQVGGLGNTMSAAPRMLQGIVERRRDNAPILNSSEAKKLQDEAGKEEEPQNTPSPQTQPGQGSGGDESKIQKYFSDAVICCPFFTPGILTAFFVLFWLLSILITGLYALMSCKTHDRYDQPHMMSLFDLPANK